MRCTPAPSESCPREAWGGGVVSLLSHSPGPAALHQESPSGHSAFLADSCFGRRKDLHVGEGEAVHPMFPPGQHGMARDRLLCAFAETDLNPLHASLPCSGVTSRAESRGTPTQPNARPAAAQPLGTCTVRAHGAGGQAPRLPPGRCLCVGVMSAENVGGLRVSPPFIPRRDLHFDYF